ncbi:zinc-binding dehydrogenase [Chloroflexota bacterium]
MKALFLKGVKDLVLEEVLVPEISDDEVLVEVKYCGICGSDVHSYLECIPNPPGSYLGHEFSGVVAGAGKKVKDWKRGERVTVQPTYVCGECYACRHSQQSECEHRAEHGIGLAGGRENAGAFARFVRVAVPEWRLHRLPDEVSFEEGALVELLACSLHGVRISGFSAGEHAMVLGAGPIGLGTIAFLKYAGAGLIIAVVGSRSANTEIFKKRAELARKLGADYVLNLQETPDLKEKVAELTDGRGVDVAFECSGAPRAFLSAPDFLKRRGRVLLLGVIEEECPIIPHKWSYKELRLQGSSLYGADEFPIVIEFLKKGILPVKEMITSKIYLRDVIEQGFNVKSKPGNDEIKILVEPDG